jgi:Tfp pilus assembly protein PilF
LPKVSALSPDERVTEDLNVAKFYVGRGNYEAAYLRSKDATKVMPDDAESHFSLAQAAQKLKKNDEAIAEYTLYLKLDPGGDWAKAAERALTELR